MPWAAAAAVAGAAISANAQSNAAKKGAAAQGAASDAAIAEQRRQYDLTRQDQLPFLQAAQGALTRQEAFLTGDTSGFENSSDYLFARDQALQGQERGAAARGGFMGGGADADRIALASGLATQNANNYWSRLAGQTGQGYQAAANLGQLGGQAAQNIGQSLNAAGNARASSYNNTANAWGDAATTAGGAFSQWYGNLGEDTQGRYLGNQRGRG